MFSEIINGLTADVISAFIFVVVGALAWYGVEKVYKWYNGSTEYRVAIVRKKSYDDVLSESGVQKIIR